VERRTTRRSEPFTNQKALISTPVRNNFLTRRRIVETIRPYSLHQLDTSAE
jgi:hypothetical protein